MRALLPELHAPACRPARHAPRLAGRGSGRQLRDGCGLPQRRHQGDAARGAQQALGRRGVAGTLVGQAICRAVLASGAEVAACLSRRRVLAGGAAAGSWGAGRQQWEQAAVQ